MDTQSRIRLLIVEDHASVRAGIRALLLAAADVEVVGEAADGGQAVEMVTQNPPDFILLDMELPVMGGVEVLRRVLQEFPMIQVLVLSGYDDLAYIEGTLAEGAKGYLLKDEAPALLVEAIHKIHDMHSGRWLSPEIEKRLAHLL